jgi:hypothetical protein
VLVSARRLAALGVVEAELPTPAPATETARPLSAPELVTAEPVPCAEDEDQLLSIQLNGPGRL